MYVHCTEPSLAGTVIFSKSNINKIWPKLRVLNDPIKVQLFWEGHKNLRNLPHGFDIYLVNVKTTRKIAEIFVAFSEKLNFKALVFSNVLG